MANQLVAVSVFAFLYAFAPAFCFGDPPKPPGFKEYRLTIGDKVGSKVIEDFNLDGLKDILVTEGRRASLFLQDGEGGFRRRPDQIWRFDPDVVLYDVGDIGDHPSKDLVCMTANEAFYYPFRDGRLIAAEKRGLFKLKTIVERLEGATLRRKDFLLDLDNDGDDDLIAPCAGTYALFRQGPKGILKQSAEMDAQVASQIFIPERGAFFRMVSAFQIPKITFGDFNGDGKRDLVLRRDDALAVFAENEKGTFSIQSTLALKAKGQQEKRSSLFAPTMRVEIQDLDKDGTLDVVVTDNHSPSPKAKVKHTTGVVKIYLSPGVKARNGKLGRPAQVIKWKDRFVLGARLLDLNNDGLDDIGVLTMKRFGLWGAIKIVISRKLKFRLYIFLQKSHAPGGSSRAAELPYPAKPDLKRDITVPFVLRKTASEIKIGSPLLLTLDGDFNGDGRRDWVYKDKSDRLSFYFGAEKEIFKKSRGYKQKIMDTSSFQFVAPIVDDLNGDGVSDLVLHYQGWEDEKDAVNVILSVPARSRGE